MCARGSFFFLIEGFPGTFPGALLRSATCRSMELTSGMNTVTPLPHLYNKKELHGCNGGLPWLNKENKRCETIRRGWWRMKKIVGERFSFGKRDSGKDRGSVCVCYVYVSARARGKIPGTSGARGENKGKARKMCLTWQRQFFSRSCRLNVRRREAIGSQEEPAGKMAAISLQPPVEVSPLLPLILSLPSSFSCRDLRKEPRSRNNGGDSAEETLILINCLIFPRDVRHTLSLAGLVHISLDHC